MEVSSAYGQGVTPALPLSLEITAALGSLRTLEGVAQAALDQATPAAKSGNRDNPVSEFAGKPHALLTLARLLPLYFRADPDGSEPDLAFQLLGIYHEASKNPGEAEQRQSGGTLALLCQFL
jgi:hypothetical protein